MTFHGTDHKIKGNIFDIQGFSVFDGPGCRTLIFLQGCTLNCEWCSNPEGINAHPIPMYNASKCIYDGNCVKSCKLGALKITKDKLVISPNICLKCTTYDCVDECYTDALQICGKEVTTEDLFKQIQRDRQYWGKSGGITLTGGEPLLQFYFALDILKKCHNSYIHTAIETCGNVPWENFEKVLQYTDWIFYDLKHMDTTSHKRLTGTGNRQILENSTRLAAEFPGRLIFRLPVIPGFNDSSENIRSLASFIKDTGRKELNILPLHHLGREKYNLLNLDYPARDFPVPSNKDLKRIEAEFIAQGISCYRGNDTPF